MYRLKFYLTRINIRLVFISIIILFINATPSYSGSNYFDTCSILSNSIKENITKLELNKAKYIPGSGTYLKKQIQNSALIMFEDDPIKANLMDLPYARSKNNYLILGSTFSVQQDKYNKPNAMIFSMNNIETSQMNDKEADVNWTNIKSFTIIEEDTKFGKKHKYKRKPGNEEWYMNRLAYAHVTPHAISNIDTLTGTFDAGYTFETIWSAEKLIKLADDVYFKAIEKDMNQFNENIYCELSEKQMQGIFQPNLILGNKILDYQNESTSYVLIYRPMRVKEGHTQIANDADKVTNSSVQISKIIKGSSKFLVDFDFRSFPFDKQYLKFSIQKNSKPPHRSISIQGTYHFGQFIQDYKNLNLIEWKKTDIDLFYKPVKFIAYNWEHNSHAMELVYVVERYFDYFLFKIILPIFLILILAWSTFWISAKELESRLTVSVVCFLSLIAYTFVIDESLPKLSYLTVMDMLILIAYIFSSIPTFQSIHSYLIFEKTTINNSLNYDKKFRKFVPVGFIISVVLVFSIFTTDTSNTISALNFIDK